MPRSPQLPTISHLQFLTLGVLLAAEQPGRVIRDAAAAYGFRRTAAAFGGKHLITHRIVNDTDLNHAGVLQSDRDAETRISMRVVGGAVERIDDPLPLAAPAA